VLAGDCLSAARSLIGARLVRSDGSGVRIGRIVEVEAYVGTDDLASHARFGRTARNAVMFGPPGRAYVYLVYGMHNCLNVVTEPEGRAAAVLIRAVEPIEGADLMRRARLAWIETRAGRTSTAGKTFAWGARARLSLGAVPDAALASGPGLVCAAFSIARPDTGTDLCDPAASLHLETAAAGDPPRTIESGPRVGIGYATEPWRSVPWRFWAAGADAVSGGRRR
jgi:DNA-3-methyladenine glycosylase